MRLLDILDEISVGYNNSDPKSQKLKAHVQEVQTILEKEGTILDSRSVRFEMNLRNDYLDNIGRGSQIFLQGSYAISTAIKHSKYDVDADIGFYVNEELTKNSRGKVYTSLKHALPRYVVTLRKPCIEIDFQDGYKIDVAIYSKNSMEQTDDVFFHNSIMGIETVTKSRPKEVVEYFKGYLSNDSTKRSVVRLMKHFLKTVQSQLMIDENNKLPSISLMIIAAKKFRPYSDTVSEDNLKKFIIELCDLSKETIKSGEEISESDLLIYNTLYKVKDINEIIKMIEVIKSNLLTDNYSNITSSSVYQSVQQKQKIDTTPALKGTMG